MNGELINKRCILDMKLEKHYSLEYLHSISGGDENFVIEMIQTFISEVPEELNKIKIFVQQKNWVKAGQTAHKFASNLLFLEIKDLKNMAIQIEENGINNVNTDAIPELSEKLEYGCYQIIDELKRDFNL